MMAHSTLVPNVHCSQQPHTDNGRIHPEETRKPCNCTQHKRAEWPTPSESKHTTQACWRLHTPLHQTKHAYKPIPNTRIKAIRHLYNHASPNRIVSEPAPKYKHHIMQPGLQQNEPAHVTTKPTQDVPMSVHNESKHVGEVQHRTFRVNMTRSLHVGWLHYRTMRMPVARSFRELACNTSQAHMRHPVAFVWYWCRDTAPCLQRNVRRVTL